MNVTGHISFPHVFQPTTVRGIYGKLILALLPVAAFGVHRGGITALMVVIVAVGTGVVSEFILDMILNSGDRQPVSRNGRILYLTVFLSLMLPFDTPPVVVALAAAVTVVVGVHLMGGTGVYYINPVFLGLLVAGVAGMSTAPVHWGDLAVPSTALVADSRFYQFMMDYVFIPLGMRVPPEAISLIVNLGETGAVSIGASLVVPLLLGAVLVLGEDLIPAGPVAAYAAGAVAVLYVADADIVDLMVRSNMMLVFFFGMVEPSTRPVRWKGMVLYGLLAGGLSALFLVVPGPSMPVAAAMVIVSVFLPLIDQLLDQLVVRR